MAYSISSECIACGRCFNICPIECIYAGDGQYDVNQDACVDCGTCASVCPISAITSNE